MNGICRICGQPGEGQAFDEWVRPTFTDWDKLQPGDILCDACAFWFEEQSQELAGLTGKDKPQRMRNYSHFIKSGAWTPLSKGDKARMRELLLDPPFPELAAVADSGQKHIVFRAPRNPPGALAGWVQFEEQAVFVEPTELARLLAIVEALYLGFSKAEIGAGSYAQHRIQKFGLAAWHDLESQIRPERGRPLLDLALFLAQKREETSDNANDGRTREGGRPAGRRVARGAGGVQEPVPDEHLDPVRGPDPSGGLHEQSGEVRQLALF